MKSVRGHKQKSQVSAKRENGEDRTISSTKFVAPSVSEAKN